MPNLNTINSAVYKFLSNDNTLTGLCNVYKGAKRPINATNPSVTVDAKRLEPGEGEGIWMCDIVVTSYIDVQSNRMPDHDALENIVSRVTGILSDKEIVLNDAKALPLIEGESKGPEWQKEHDNETMHESIFGLIFIDFN